MHVKKLGTEEELVDIVDENDKVIGKEYKSVCRANNLLHRGADVLVFKDDSYKQVLVQKRSKQVSSPGKKGFPAGALASGEDYREGAARELREECFYQHPLPEEVNLNEAFKVKVRTDGDYHIIAVFSTVYSGPLYNNPHEVEELFFEDVEELAKKVEANPDDYIETLRVLLKEYMGRSKK